MIAEYAEFDESKSCITLRKKAFNSHRYPSKRDRLVRQNAGFKSPVLIRRSGC